MTKLIPRKEAFKGSPAFKRTVEPSIRARWKNGTLKPSMWADMVLFGTTSKPILL